MREREDAIRSVRRYVSSALGSPPWRVRFEMDARFKRPFALVNPPPTGGDVTVDGVSSARQQLPLVIQAYPEEPDAKGPAGTSEARMRAERAAELITQALLVGVVDGVDPEVRGYTHRIPLWDYHDDAGEPLPLDGPQSVATRRHAPDYLWVADGWSVYVQPEASERQLFVAIANLRVQWFRSTQLAPTGPPLETVPGQPALQILPAPVPVDAPPPRPDVQLDVTVGTGDGA